MLTTQIQVLLYVGSTQVVSCSIFVPLPAIVVKSHQTLEAILPYLPLSLKASPESQESDPSSPSRPQSPTLPPIPDGSSSSLILASTPTSTSSPLPFPPSSSHHSHRHNHRRNGNSHHHSSRDNSSSSSNNNNHKVSSNRVSPDCSIPSTTCIKISLQPTPTFKLVKPRCPHQTHRSKNLQHYLQHHQLPLPPSTSEGGEDHSHSSHSHRSHRHSHHSRRNHHNHHHNDSTLDIDDHSNSHSHSQSHSHSRNHHHSTYSHSPNHPQHHHRFPPQQHQRSYSSMAAIEYPTIHQSSTPSFSSSSTSVSVLFTFPFDYNSKPTPESVQVTGSFNSWDRTPMSKNQTASRFESTIEIDLTAHTDLKDDNNKVKILFKFVLDGQDWVTDAQQPLERDQQGNLNNVLILDVPVIVGTAHTSSSSTTTPSAEQETDAQKIARQKQEEEDDAVIRQLGGGMWGAPMFAVNDPVSLPEHFVESSSQEADNTDDKDKETVEEKEKGQEVQETPVTASPSATETEAKQETEEERAARLKEEEDDAIIRKFGGGMWGAPMFAVNDPVNLPEHFPETVTEAVTEAAPPAPEITETPSVSAPGLVSPAAAPVAVPTVEEDEDDVIIRQLGGGMWGAPNFKVNDPANLPEHFVEAVMKDPEVSSSSTKSNGKEKVAESVTVAEKVAFTAPITNSSSAQTIVEGQVVKDEFVKTISGTLIETVVETTEDIVIQAPDGTILEETITTDVQESVQGVLLESVTETTEIIEEIEEPVPGTNDASVAVEGVTEVVMMEEEEIKIVQGEDGVATTIVEDTITFMDGPEVDSSSLHSITTSIKPVQEGESFLVEQAPAVHVDSVEILTSAPGYAKPSVDLSADVVAIPSSNVSSARTRVNGDEHDGDGDYGVVVLQVEPLTSGRQSVAGDAKPSIDMSVSTTQTIIAPSPSPASPSKAEPGLKAVKSEKRKSGLWKKIKKVLS